MKSVNINIEFDSDNDTVEQHELDCLTTVNGQYYYNSLRDVCMILMNYEKNSDKKLSKESKTMLEDILTKCAIKFRGLNYE